MAGGNWETQNKVLNGAYVNFESNDIVATGLDSRGTEVIPLAADWGETGKFIRVSTNTDFVKEFGVPLDGLLPIKEAFKGTGDILVYILNDAGEKATATSGTFTATAVHGGTAGNKIVVKFTKALDGNHTVKTYFNGVEKDKQEVASTEKLVANDYASFSGALPLEDATLSLSGGTTAEVTNESYTVFAAGLDTQRFKTIALSSDEETIKTLMTLKVKQWREQEGKNVTLITNDYNAADFEGVVSIKNGVYVGDTFIPAKDAVYWYAGAYANAITNSLTYAEYPGATDVEELTFDEKVKAIQQGHVIFIYDAGADGVDRVVVETDINTFRSFTPEKNQDFRKGKIVRQMDIVSNNVQHIWSRFFIGKVNNNEDGRNLFKGQVMKVILDPMVSRGAIEPYDPADLVFKQGDQKDAVLSRMGLKFVDAMEKLYMTVDCK